MKTPMQELLDILIDKKKNTFEAPLSDTRVALDFAIEQTRLMLEKEKETIKDAYDAGLFDGSMDDVDDRLHKNYYNETFKTKEK